MQFRRPTKPGVTINIAPLVDVIFLLVIFFAVTTTFLETAGLELELPESTSSAPQEHQRLTVVLAADGSLSFDGETVEADGLAARLRGALAAQERKQVVLRADAQVRHGDVVRVMDAIRDAGAEGLTVSARSAAP